MASNVLADRDGNLPLRPSQNENAKPTSTDLQRKMFESRVQDGESQKYISPSDAILSPASQKLNAFKSKQAFKKTKPQTLFATATSKPTERSIGENMFADVPTDRREDNDGSTTG